jgi:adenylate cyclase
MNCPKCKFENPEGIKYCGKCGSKITSSYEIIKTQNPSKSERKHATVFFTDLSGYTAMTERLDPEDVRSTLNRVFKKISDIIEKFDGFIERYIGDSVMAVFGIPKAHEDDPVRAVNAALEIHETIKSMDSGKSRASNFYAHRHKHRSCSNRKGKRKRWLPWFNRAQYQYCITP